MSRWMCVVTFRNRKRTAKLMDCLIIVSVEQVIQVIRGTSTQRPWPLCFKSNILTEVISILYFIRNMIVSNITSEMAKIKVLSTSRLYV